MALETVQDYISEARVLLLDETAPFRYSDLSIVSALNLAIGESSRIRPDMWLAYFELALPAYVVGSLGAAVDIPASYRMAFLYFIVGHCQLRDDEDVSDARAGALIQKFSSSLLMVA